MCKRKHPLKVYRWENDLTLRALGEQCGIPSAMLSQIEGYKVSPSLRTVAKITKVTGLPVDAFMPQEDAAECHAA